jgi:DNA gyrase subunit B
MAYLTKGLFLHFRDERGLGDERSYYFDSGIEAFVRQIGRSRSPLHDPIVVFNETENAQVEVALQYNASYGEVLYSFANAIKTIDGGSHVTGFRTALTRVLNDYARKSKILKDSDPNLTGDDVREGLACVISVKLSEPQFEGQTKTRLGNPEIKGLVESAVGTRLQQELEENPGMARRILEKCLTAARAREAARKARDLVQRKGVLEGSNLPGKLADCSETPASASSTSSRVTRLVAPPRAAATAGRRQSCRCAARSSTSRRRASTRCSRTSRSGTSSRHSAPASVKSSTPRSCATTRSSS